MKFFHSKRRILILLFIFLIMYLVYYFFIPQHIAPLGTQLSEKQLVHDLKLIGNRYDKTIGVRIFPNTSDYNVKNEHGLVDRDDKIVYVLATNKFSGEINHPFEVRAAIRTWLYLINRVPPYPVVAVEGDYNRSWGMFGHHAVVVSKSEFQKFYDEAIKDSNLAQVKDTEQLVNLLSDRWVEENHYSNWWKNEKK